MRTGMAPAGPGTSPAWTWATGSGSPPVRRVRSSSASRISRGVICSTGLPPANRSIRALACGSSGIRLLQSRVEHNPNRPVAALDERRPGVGKLVQAEAVGDQRPDVDRATGEQLQAPPRDAPRVGERAVDVEVAADDRAQVDARQLATRAGRPGQHDTTAPT